MDQYIDKSTLVAELKRRVEAHEETLKNCDSSISEMVLKGSMSAYQSLLHFLETIEVKYVDLESENENNNSKITIGTKICLKDNPNVILSIISNDCHDDEFECSNGSVLSLKQIEKYYDIYTEEK